MIYGDNIRKVMRLLESENINPGNLLIGQTVEVAVTDAKGTEFLRPMIVGEFYPDGSVLLKDPATQRSVVFQFQWNRSSMSKDLIYTAKSDFGVAYRFAISKELMSNKSVTKLSEKKLTEAKLFGDKKMIAEVVRDDFETGQVSYKNLSSFERDLKDDLVSMTPKDAYKYYNELIEMGPSGFYEEYKDSIKFSNDYKSEYGEKMLNESDEDKTASVLNSSKVSRYWSKTRPKLTEARIPKGKGRINYDDDLVKVYKDGKIIYSGEEDYEPMNQENWKYNETLKAYELPGGYVKILIG